MSNNKPICYMIISSFLFATLYMFSKCAHNLTPFQKSLISNIIALFLISTIMIKNGISFVGKKENRNRLLIRGLCGSISLILLHYSIAHLSLAQSTMLNKLSPFFAIILGIIILKDKISIKQIIFFFITIVGMLLIIKPTFNITFLPFLIGLLSSILASIAFFMIRLIGKSESSYTIIFYNLFFSLIINIPFSILNFKNFNYKFSIIYMIFGGLCISFGQLFLTLAYSSSPASNIAIYDYIGLIFSGIYDYFIFSYFPDYISLIGYLLIIVCALLNANYLKKTN